MRTRFEALSPSEVDEMLAELATFRDTVLANARLQQGEIVVDVGAGTGLLTVAAADLVAPDGEVLAIDLSVDALEELRHICKAPNVFYLVGTANVLPLPDGAADAIVTRSVLIYVENKAEAIAEFFRALRPGGRVSIFEPINRRNTRLSQVVDFGELREQVVEWERATYEDPDDPMLNFDEHDLERLFREAGFDDVTTDLRLGEGEMSPERQLTSVGAPGRKSLLDAWRSSFPVDVVERLATQVRAAGAVRRAWPQLYLHAHKP